VALANLHYINALNNNNNNNNNDIIHKTRSTQLTAVSTED